MNSKEYWAKREAENLRKNLKSEAEYLKEIQEIYRYTLDQIQKEIDSFYTKYAKKEGISIAAAKKRASKLDMDEFSRKAKKYVKEKNFSEQANAEMRLYNLTMKVNRLELLKANIGLELVSSFDELQQFYEEKLTERTLAEFQRQAGILGLTVLDNAKMAEAIVNASFKNATFSDRIWMHQDLLRAELEKLLRTGLIQGKSSRELARQLRKVFDTSIYNSERLLRTELARVQTEVQKQSYVRNGNDEYEYMTANPMGPCSVCKELNGKVFKVEDMMPGENAPPMHPNCHCTTAPYWDREEFNRYINSDTDLSFADWKVKNAGESVFFSDKSFSNGKSKSEKELLTMTQLSDKIISKHTNIESKWSGKVNRVIDNNINYSGKEWNCDITLLNTATTHQAIHELMHARSISHYGPTTYRQNRAMEELAVEFFTQQILKKEKIAKAQSTAYRLSIKRLEVINQRTGLYKTDYDFAKALFETPLPQRERWLRDKIFEGSETLVDYNRTIKYLEKVLRWKRNTWTV